MLLENKEVISFVPGCKCNHHLAPSRRTTSCVTSDTNALLSLLYFRYLNSTTDVKSDRRVLGRIVVHDRIQVEAKVLPRYFNHSSFASLRRQLNYFSFVRLGKGRQRESTYVNENVIELDDILHLKRRSSSAAASNGASTAAQDAAIVKEQERYVAEEQAAAAAVAAANGGQTLIASSSSNSLSVTAAAPSGISSSAGVGKTKMPTLCRSSGSKRNKSSLNLHSPPQPSNKRRKGSSSSSTAKKLNRRALPITLASRGAAAQSSSLPTVDPSSVVLSGNGAFTTVDQPQQHCLVSEDEISESNKKKYIALDLTKPPPVTVSMDDSHSINTGAGSGGDDDLLAGCSALLQLASKRWN